jgi:raffinose/stachyose/melibiose transport system permease protein
MAQTADPTGRSARVARTLERPARGRRGSLSQGGPARRRRRRNWSLALFLVPPALVYVVFLVAPTLASFGMSLTDWNGVSNAAGFVGTGNFRRLAGDPIFRQAIGTNVRFSLTVLVFQTLLSLGLALLLVRNTRTNIALRALYFLPTVVAAVSVGLAWILMYDPNFGALNATLDAVGLGELAPSWLGDTDIAVYSLAVVQFWQHTGQVMIIFIAGLQSIPRELYEAAAVDGATRRQTFWSITRPLLAPAAAIVVAYTTIQTFKAFDLVIALTDGAFNTEILSTWIYHQAFQYFEFGYGAAGAVVFLLILGALTALQFRILRVDQ